ncbi:hypothetical protein ACL02R_28385 [Streptomyces sp. MS19]|uniref:hypothetical protein n=1 Tax=Streptomyces sp. MS19 TaxID=3385972 RepID=UPI0039A21497
MADKWVDTVTVERQGFRISVPDSWWEFDLRPETRDNSIRRMVDERVRNVPELAEHREVVASFLRRQARQAWDTGAVYCGCMAQSFGGGPPITASVTVSIVGARTASGEVLPTDPAAIVSRLGTRVARREGDAWRDVTTVDIPEVGQAARTKGVEDISVPGDTRTIRAVLMQTFIPLPGDQQAVALVAGSSQVLDLADSFFDVFDAVTSTFRFTAE